MYTIKHHESKFMPATSYLYCIDMDIPDEFKIIHWLCTHTVMLNYVELPYIRLAVADPGGWNRCVCNGQIFLVKNAN